MTTTAANITLRGRILNDGDLYKAAFEALLNLHIELCSYEDAGDDPRVEVGEMIASQLWGYHPLSSEVAFNQFQAAVTGWVMEREDAIATQRELEDEVRAAERAAGWSTSP